MDCVIIANAWGAGETNPTSKHRIALELARRGGRVLWVEGAGMRRPSLGSGSDRRRMWQKVRAATRGARRVFGQDERSAGKIVGGKEVSSNAPPPAFIWALSPLLIPLPKHGAVRWFNGWLTAKLARRWCKMLGMADPVLINYVPVLCEAMRAWRGGCGSIARENSELRIQNSDISPRHSDTPTPPPRVVYHCVDRWDAFSTYDADVMRKCDERCCRYADVVMASSSELEERCRLHNANTHLLLHGVDWEHFRPSAEGVEQETKGRRQQMTDSVCQPALGPGHGALHRASRPADLPEGRIIGFFGLLSEWVDQELLVKLARSLWADDRSSGTGRRRAPVLSPQPAVSMVLIGKSDVDISRLVAEPNIHILGPKPFADLPRYAACFDVGIIPFVVNELTRAVNPIKLREMLAAGVPVVSTALPEVQRYAGRGGGGRGASVSPVAVAGDAAEFVSMVKAVLEHPLTLDERRVLSETMARESWRAKVDEMLRIISHG